MTRVPVSRQRTGRIPATVQPIVQVLSNWQRNQWARAGYKPELAARFAGMRKPT